MKLLMVISHISNVKDSHDSTQERRAIKVILRPSKKISSRYLKGYWPTPQKVGCHLFVHRPFVVVVHNMDEYSLSCPLLVLLKGEFTLVYLVLSLPTGKLITRCVPLLKSI